MGGERRDEAGQDGVPVRFAVQDPAHPQRREPGFVGGGRPEVGAAGPLPGDGLLGVQPGQDGHHRRVREVAAESFLHPGGGDRFRRVVQRGQDLRLQLALPTAAGALRAARAVAAGGARGTPGSAVSGGRAERSSEGFPAHAVASRRAGRPGAGTSGHLTTAVAVPTARPDSAARPGERAPERPLRDALWGMTRRERAVGKSPYGTVSTGRANFYSPVDFSSVRRSCPVRRPGCRRSGAVSTS